MTEARSLSLQVGDGLAGTRLDQAVARLVPDVSRTRAQRLIELGLVTVGGSAVTKRRVVRTGERIDVTVPPPAESAPRAESIPLEILYEDDDLVAVNKPAGMVVHPAPGHSGGTLVNALLGALPRLSGVGGELRPGIVHRLDKGTSGVILAALNDRGHNALAAQFAGRSVRKLYLALVWGSPRADAGVLTDALGRDARKRTRISSRTRRPRTAVTRWRVLERRPGTTLLEVRPETGRTHQIRVHLSGVGHPVLGDPLYGIGGARRNAYRGASLRLGFAGRLALHAWKLAFARPSDGAPLEVVAPPPPALAPPEKP